MDRDPIHIMHVVPRVVLGGIWRYCQYASLLEGRGTRVSILSIFDCDDDIAVEQLGASVTQLRLPLSEFRARSRITARVAEVIAAGSVDCIQSHHYYSDI